MASTRTVVIWLNGSEVMKVLDSGPPATLNVKARKFAEILNESPFQGQSLRIISAAASAIQGSDIIVVELGDSGATRAPKRSR